MSPLLPLLLIGGGIAFAVSRGKGGGKATAEGNCSAFDKNIDAQTCANVLKLLASTDQTSIQNYAVNIEAKYPIAANALLKRRMTLLCGAWQSPNPLVYAYTPNYDYTANPLGLGPGPHGLDAHFPAGLVSQVELAMMITPQELAALQGQGVPQAPIVTPMTPDAQGKLQLLKGTSYILETPAVPQTPITTFVQAFSQQGIQIASYWGVGENFPSSPPLDSGTWRFLVQPTSNQSITIGAGTSAHWFRVTPVTASAQSAGYGVGAWLMLGDDNHNYTALPNIRYRAAAVLGKGTSSSSIVDYLTGNSSLPGNGGFSNVTVYEQDQTLPADWPQALRYNPLPSDDDNRIIYVEGFRVGQQQAYPDTDPWYAIGLHFNVLGVYYDDGAPAQTPNEPTTTPTTPGTLPPVTPPTTGTPMKILDFLSGTANNLEKDGFPIAADTVRSRFAYLTSKCNPLV